MTRSFNTAIKPRLLFGDYDEVDGDFPPQGKGLLHIWTSEDEQFGLGFDLEGNIFGWTENRKRYPLTPRESLEWVIALRNLNDIKDCPDGYSYDGLNRWIRIIFDALPARYLVYTPDPGGN